MKILNIKDYSIYTGLRHCDISENSGEHFYHTKLNEIFYEILSNNEKLTVNLDGTDGYAPSFLDEAFGNLVFDFGLDKVKNHIIIISDQEPHWKEMIENNTYSDWETRRKKSEAPKVTIPHSPWYRLIGGNYEKRRWSQRAI